MKDLLKRVKEKAHELFGIDYRTLAFFRILLGIIIICDLIVRSSYLKTFYTDLGVMPRQVIFEKYTSYFWSLHFLSGSEYFQGFLFLIAFVFALMLIFGYKSRFATIASWIFLVSLQNRNPLVLQGGDVLFRMILFWAMFLPLGKIYSVDYFLRKDKEKNIVKSHLSFATFGIMMQVALLYVYAAILKTGKEWLTEGSAIYYALSLDQFVTPIGKILFGNYELMKTLTFGVWWFELLAVFFFFIPFLTGWIRTIMVFAFVFFQAGMGSSLYLGPFPWIASIAVISFLPSLFWDKIKSKINFNSRKKIEIYYDGKCNFCRRMLRIVLGFLFLKNVNCKPAQSNSKMYGEMLRENSWIVIDSSGKHYNRFSAFYPVFSASPIFFIFSFVFLIPGIKQIGNLIYRFVANDRTVFSTFLKEPIEFSEKTKKTLFLIGNVIALFFVVFVFAWNLQSIGYDSIPDKYEKTGFMFRVDQKWDMFAPFPLKEDGWYVIPGKLLNGTEIDLWNEGKFGEGKVIDYRKPDNIAVQYDNQRWRKYMMNLWSASNADYRLYLGKWICRNWNSEHTGKSQLEAFNVTFVKELTLPNYQYSQPENVVIWEHWCFK